jgi:hypothetical protein
MIIWLSQGGGKLADGHTSGDLGAQVNSSNKSVAKGNSEQLAAAGSINREENNNGNNNQNNNKAQTAKEPLTCDFNKNHQTIKDIFSSAINDDFIIREISIESLQKDAVLIFLQGMTDTSTMER